MVFAPGRPPRLVQLASLKVAAANVKDDPIPSATAKKSQAWKRLILGFGDGSSELDFPRLQALRAARVSWFWVSLTTARVCQTGAVVSREIRAPAQLCIRLPRRRGGLRSRHVGRRAAWRGFRRGYSR